MKRLLGEEFDSFLASFDAGRQNALRVNRLKITPEEFEEAAPFHLERVPWTDNGYYVDYRDMPGQHPWYRAGLYYLQEPSAMAPAEILPVTPGDRVLDLCAAPGGKATELGAKLGGKGILVANEISQSRVRALQRNIELFGITNSVVTNESPSRLSERFPEYFDKVLVDAPCSGEGMFRKMPEAVKAWYPEKVHECAAVQREILLRAADMLCPGGYMVYSTCTFEPEENELAIAHLLRKRPDMRLIRIPRTGGRESFSRAYSLRELYGKGFRVPEDELRDMKGLPEQDPAWREAGMVSGSEADLTCAVRIWPHRAGGEGHFTALLRKQPVEDLTETGCAPGSKEKNTDVWCPAPKRENEIPGAGRGGQKREYGIPGAGLGGRKREYGISGAGRGGQKREYGMSGAGRGGPKRAAAALRDMQLAEQFFEEYLPDRKIDIHRCEVRDGHVYLMPQDCPDVRGLKFLRAGLYLGEQKKNRFEPSQELAMALSGAEGLEKICIRMSSSDERLAAFLRGEAIRLEEAGRNGWRLVCADNWPAGWGKLNGGLLKNHIPAGWRS